MAIVIRCISCQHYHRFDDGLPRNICEQVLPSLSLPDCKHSKGHIWGWFDEERDEPWRDWELIKARRLDRVREERNKPVPVSSSARPSRPIIAETKGSQLRMDIEGGQS